MSNTSNSRSVMISVEDGSGAWIGLTFDVQGMSIPSSAHFLDDEYDLLIDTAFPWIALRTTKL